MTIAAGATSAQITLSAEATAPHSLPTDASVRGPAGSLDTSFGGGTQVSLVGIGDDYAEAMAVQSDGRIVVAGHSAMVQSTDFAVVRYLRDGGLDPSFGGTGKVVTALIPGSARDSIYALALQTVKGQAHIVAVGGEGDFAVARYTPSGALDASFDNGGKVTGLFGSIIGAARAVLVTPDNALILAGGIGATTTCWRAWARTAHWTAASVSAAS